jgi:hypothetical protein
MRACNLIEHRIRLRGGWECPTEGAKGSYDRLTLPVVWKRHGPASARLVRRFGRPSFDPASQVLVLEMKNVAGILALFLNGHPITPVAVETSSYEILVDALPERNRLEITVDRSWLAGDGRSELPWGEIALVVRSDFPAAL